MGGNLRKMKSAGGEDGPKAPEKRSGLSKLKSWMDKLVSLIRKLTP